MTRRGTSNSAVRGSSYSRRRRRQWLVDNHGDGTTVACSTCPAVLTVETLTVDRWPVAGVDGGRYVLGNIRAQCSTCASAQGGRMAAERRDADLWLYALPAHLRPGRT